MTPFQARRYYGKDLTIAREDISNDAIFSLARQLPSGTITNFMLFCSWGIIKKDIYTKLLEIYTKILFIITMFSF